MIDKWCWETSDAGKQGGCEHVSLSMAIIDINISVQDCHIDGQPQQQKWSRNEIIGICMLETNLVPYLVYYIVTLQI